MGSFWKNIGKALAMVGKGALKGAVWASQHPEVIAIIESVALSKGANPTKVGQVDQGVQIGLQVASAIQQAKGSQGDQGDQGGQSGA